jgi:hypothetical protein
MTTEQIRAAWSDLSRQAAQMQKGTVTSFGGGAGPSTIWKTVELPTLMSNPSVTKIIIQDSVNTAQTTTIYK